MMQSQQSPEPIPRELWSQDGPVELSCLETRAPAFIFLPLDESDIGCSCPWVECVTFNEFTVFSRGSSYSATRLVADSH